MSTIRVDSIVNTNNTGSPRLPYGVINSFQIIKFDVANTVNLSGGIVTLANYEEYITSNGVTLGVDLSINLKTEVNSTGVTSPAGNQTYWLYLKRNSAGAPTMTSLQRSVRPCLKGIAGAFIVLPDSPTTIDQTNYIPIALLRTDGLNNYTIYQNISYSMPAATLVTLTSNFGEYTKFVGFGVGTFPTLEDAIAVAVVGDSILVNETQVVTAPLTVNVNNIRITFMPNTGINVESGAGGLYVVSDFIEIAYCTITILTGATATNAVNVTGKDCHLKCTRVIANSGGSSTNGYNIDVTAERTYVEGSIRSIGTITNKVVDSGLDTELFVRGL